MPLPCRIAACLAIGLFVAAATSHDSTAQERRGPFNHDPRSVRSRDIDQQHLRLELTFNFDKQEFRGRAVHKLSLYDAAVDLCRALAREVPWVHRW